MPVNIKNILTSVQKKVNNITTATGNVEILNTLKAVKKIDGASLAVYDSDGVLPIASTSNQKLAYVKNTGKFKFNNGSWDVIGQGKGLPLESVQDVIRLYGLTTGYNAGGNPYSNIIDKFPFATAEASTDVGDLTSGRQYTTGHQSKTDAYFAGGIAPTISPTGINVIDKMPFTAEGNSSDIADLTVVKYDHHGQSSFEYGYTNGGVSAPGASTTIDKFSFSADANATSVGSLAQATDRGVGISSHEHGYIAGYQYGTTIQKFSFSTDGNSTNVGNLSANRARAAGMATQEYGYTGGGLAPPYTNIIDKFPFASDGTATNVGSLAFSSGYNSGVSSATDGFVADGYNASYAPASHKQKFPFAIDGGTATDHGELSASRYAFANGGAHY